MSNVVTIIGAGLAGSEAALQLAARGHRVRLLEQKPEQRTPAQTSEHVLRAGLLELVPGRGAQQRRRPAQARDAAARARSSCRSRMKHEYRRAARWPWIASVFRDDDAPPASSRRTSRSWPGAVDALPAERPLLVATGPLTGDSLARDIAAQRRGRAPGLLRRHRAHHQRGFHRLDAGVHGVALGQGQHGRRAARLRQLPAQSRAVRARSWRTLLAAQKVQPKSFEDVRYFEGCLPIEVMAERGPRTLAFGPMKPVGLTDPRTGSLAARGRAAAQRGRGAHGLQHGWFSDSAHVG